MKKYPDEERLSHISKLWYEDKEQAIQLSWEWIKTGKFTKVEYKILLEQYAKYVIDNNNKKRIVAEIESEELAKHVADYYK